MGNQNSLTYRNSSKFHFIIIPTYNIGTMPYGYKFSCDFPMYIISILYKEKLLKNLIFNFQALSNKIETFINF